jgi:hypothetical protein
MRSITAVMCTVNDAVFGRLRRDAGTPYSATCSVAELEKLDVDSPEFEQKFGSFREDVTAHAEAEESEEFSQLADQLDDSQLARMRKAAELAEKTAPTHPHAGVESRAANLAAGPFAAMLDRAKDLISS